MKAIEIDDLHVRFESLEVLRGVDFAVDAGETTVIAGASGSGKSVLLKTIIGLIAPEKGTVRILGRDTTGFSRHDWSAVRREIGIVFQGNALFDSLPVWENVGFYLLQNSRETLQEIRARASGILSLVGLSGTEDNYPAELSGGMQKRVALARTLIFNPRIILYDEPTVGLDPVTAESIEDLIIELREKLKNTALVVTHDQHFTFKVANRVGLLMDGKIRAFGTGREIVGSPDEAVRKFFRLDQATGAGSASRPGVRVAPRGLTGVAHG